MENCRLSLTIRVDVQDPDLSLEWSGDSSFEATMECVDMYTNTACRKLDGTAYVALPSSNSQFIPPNSFAPYSAQKWTAKVTKNCKSATAEAIIVYLEEIIPTLSISYPEGYLLREVNVNEKISVES